MLVPIFLALFLPCAGMCSVFVVYICLLWYSANNNNNNNNGLQEQSGAKQASKIGLSPSDLNKLPRVTGRDLVLGRECAVCLEDIEEDAVVRIIPACNHGFHLHCADAWLSTHPLCPLCRTTLTLNLDFDHPC